MAADQALLDRICERLSCGDSLRKICRDEGMPTEGAIRQWAKTEPFAAQYAQAREDGYALLADELVQIADDGLNDTYVDDNGFPRTDHDVIARSKLRVDTRKWMLSKMLPKLYGDKLQHANAAGDGDQVTNCTFSWSDKPKSG